MIHSLFARKFMLFHFGLNISYHSWGFPGSRSFQSIRVPPKGYGIDTLQL